MFHGAAEDAAPALRVQTLGIIRARFGKMTVLLADEAVGKAVGPLPLLLRVAVLSTSKYCDISLLPYHIIFLASMLKRYKRASLKVIVLHNLFFASCYCLPCDYIAKTWLV